MTNKISVYRGLVAGSEELRIEEVTPEVLAENMLRSGLDLKGQSQIALLASGYGGGVEASAGVGFAAIEASVAANRLNQSLLVALRGPQQLDGLAFDTPMALLSLTGSKWTATAEAKASVGFVAETGFELGSSGTDAKAEAGFTGPDEVDEDFSVEGLAVGASAFAGLTVSAGASVTHYSGVDLAPVYFARRSELKQELGEALAGGDRLTALKLEANRLLNEVRQAILEFGGSTHISASDKNKDELKKALGVWDSWLKSNEKITSTSDSPQAYWDRLARLLGDSAGQASMLSLLFRGRAGCNQIRERALDLQGRFAPYCKKPATPTCGVRMWSAEVQAVAGATAEAQAGATTPLAGAVARVGAQLGADFSHRRTGIRFQVPFIAQEQRPVFYTQDTSITYSALNVDMLRVRAEIEFKTLNRTTGYDTTIRRGKSFHTMSYQSATLYWQDVGGKAAVKPGSGVSFGRSFVIKNLRKAIDPQTKSDGWIKNTAAALRVTVEQLRRFLADEEVKRNLADLNGRSQAASKLKGGFDAVVDAGWGDRAVLIEASFAVADIGSVAVKDGQPEGFKKALMGAKQRTLQSIRLRYRIADFDATERSFRLGFQILGTGLGVSIRRLEEAGAEGIVDLRTVWFVGADKSTDADRYNAEAAVPAVTLFCQ